MLQFIRASALLAALPLLVAPAAAQSAITDTSNAAKASSYGAARGGRAAPSPAEERVRKILSTPGVHVVRFWAPWCENSTDAMQDWSRLVKSNEDVSFTFVTVWNNGRGGAGTIMEHGIPLKRVTEVVPEDPEQGRLGQFLGYAVQWLPSTWIFRTGGAGEVPVRAFAMNYGEMDVATLQTLINTAQADW